MSELPEAMAGTGGQMESVLDGLSRLTDEELRGVVKHAGEILAARDKERKAEALHEIQRIAKEAGLHVGVTKPPPRKRGRPQKQEEPPG